MAASKLFRSEEFNQEEKELITTCRALVRRLEKVIEETRSRKFGCEELIIPVDLLPKIAIDIMELAYPEPGGLSACTMYIKYKTGIKCHHIANIKWDPNSVSTFGIAIILMMEESSFGYSLFPHFINKILRSGTVCISRGFFLNKMKIFRTQS